jgi:nitrogen fixation protein NifB
VAKPISLASLKTSTTTEAMQQALSSGCSSSSCGSSAAQSELPQEIWDKIKDHPCYSEEAHHYFARMHVAVAPACNIQCNYCNRKYDCANESRPGVVSEKLTPQEAVRKIIAVANEVPQLAVLGIAGPGDACYDFRKTKATFEGIVKHIPDIKLCLSTNGLSLPDHVEEIAAMNIDHVTITINMVDPEIGTKIYPWIYHQGKRYTGLDASKILHERQMLGLEMLAERKILCKVNSVLIPGINDEHLIEVSKVVKQKGAFLHNIMPLISAAEHGTYFGLNGQRSPSAAELKALQDKLSDGTKLMKHCRQCRADAVGMLGEDRGQEFMMNHIPDDVSYDSTKRDAYREVVAKERGEHGIAKQEADDRLAGAQGGEAPVLVAVATKGGGRINQHFGHAKEFQVYEVSSAGVKFSGTRRTDQYCQGGFGEEATLDHVVEALAGIGAILCAKIGDCPKESLSAAGIEASADYAHEWIEAGIGAWYQARHPQQSAAATA